MAKELAEALTNRSVAIALAVFTPHTAPTSVTPFAMVGSDVYATYDPGTDDANLLEAAYRTPRIRRCSPCATRRSSSTPRRSLGPSRT